MKKRLFFTTFVSKLKGDDSRFFHKRITGEIFEILRGRRDGNSHRLWNYGALQGGFQDTKISIQRDWFCAGSYFQLYSQPNLDVQKRQSASRARVRLVYGCFLDRINYQYGYTLSLQQKV